MHCNKINLRYFLSAPYTLPHTDTTFKQLFIVWAELLKGNTDLIKFYCY